MSFGNEHLVAVELNLVLLEFELVVHLREIEYTGEVERVVHVEVYPKEWLVCHWVKLTIELLVVFVFEICRLFCPKWCRVVDDVVFFGFHLFAILPFLFLSETESLNDSVS